MGTPDPGLDRLRVEFVEALRAVETNLERILGQRIDAVEVNLGQRIDAVEGNLNAVEGRLGQRIDGVELGLGRRLKAVEAGLASLAGYVEAGDIENRRRLDAVADSIHVRIDQVAYDLGSLNTTTKRFHGEVREELSKVDRRLLDLQLRVSALERK